MKKDCHEVICIIDRSGSMDQIKSNAIGGFNFFAKSQKNLKVKLPFLLFYSTITTILYMMAEI